MVWKQKKFSVIKNNMNNITIEEIRDSFSFLELKYGFKLIKEFNSDYALDITYKNDFIQIRLGYDYRDNFFYFYLIRGAKTQFPNDSDTENIKDFYCIVKKHSIPNITKTDLQPNEDGYSEALKLNADLLEKYGVEILQGKEWLK